MVQLVRVIDDLPDGFDALRAEADAEGFKAMSRLAAEWARCLRETAALRPRRSRIRV